MPHTDVQNELAHRLTAWYALAKRDLPWRKTADPYAIWVSEVMLQQTQVKTVIPYYENFLHSFPSIRQLASAELDEVLAVWRGLGYYSRARRLWEGARYVLENFNGRLPEDYSLLRSIPGIGDYTAGAIASIAFGLRVPAIDGNVKRVFSRLLGYSEPIGTSACRLFAVTVAQWQCWQEPGTLNQALMELGAVVCTPRRPHCGSCPLSGGCEGFRQGRAEALPVLKPKAKPRVITRVTFVVRDGDLVLLQKRPPQGMLAGLWELPGVELEGERELAELLDYTAEKWGELCRQGLGTEAYLAGEGAVEVQGPAWHVFSHRRWKIFWISLEQNRGIPEQQNFCREQESTYAVNGVESAEKHTRWATPAELAELPIPSAFSAILKDPQ